MSAALSHPHPNAGAHRRAAHPQTAALRRGGRAGAAARRSDDDAPAATATKHHIASAALTVTCARTRKPSKGPACGFATTSPQAARRGGVGRGNGRERGRDGRVRVREGVRGLEVVRVHVRMRVWVRWWVWV